MNQQFIYRLQNHPIRINAVGVLDQVHVMEDCFVSEHLPESVIEQMKAYLEGGVSLKILDQLDDQKNLSLNSIANDGHMPVFAFFIIRCERDMDAVILAEINSRSRLWVNETPVMASSHINGISAFPLHKGDNAVYIEIPAAGVDTFVAIRLSTYSFEFEHSSVSLIEGNLTNYLGNVDLVGNVTAQENGYSFDFILIPNDTIRIDSSSKIKVKMFRAFVDKAENQETVLEPICFLKKYSYFILEEDGLSDQLNEIFYAFEYAQKSGEIGFISTTNIISEMHMELDRPAQEKNDKAENVGPSKEYFFRRNEYAIKNHLVRTFRSSLDDQLESYYIRLPADYDPGKKYPVLLTFSIVRYTNDARFSESYHEEQFIAADISARGVTLGSYIGDAATQEVIEHLVRDYAVDEDRIYATGYSNGAYAVWALATHYPDRFAGIIPISGAVGKAYIHNIRNLGIVNVASGYEPKYPQAFGSIHRQLKKFDGYIGVLADQMLHHELEWIRYQKYFIDSIRKVKRSKYPDSIEYFTVKNRCLQAYWIRIHAITYGRKNARIKAQIVNNNIHVTCQNVSGFTVTIPPQINKRHFKILINQAQEFVFHRYGQSKIHIFKKPRGFAVGEAEPECDLRKGTGLLDVYMKPLRILIGDGNDAVLCHVAKQFAHPSTNGFDPVIYVDYPVATVEDFPEKYKSCSLIVVDHNIEHEFLNSLRARCPIRTSPNGYEYNGTFYPGDYCVMQVVAHPTNHDRSILYINCSHSKILRQNLFTRKVIIPSYANGLHPYWNNEGLVFRKGKYYAVYEWGEPLMEIGGIDMGE